MADDLYQREAGPQACVTSDAVLWPNTTGHSRRVTIRFVNTSSTGGTVRYGITDTGGTTIGTATLLLADLPIAGNDIVEDEFVLNPGDAVYASASATTVNVYLSALLV